MLDSQLLRISMIFSRVANLRCADTAPRGMRDLLLAYARREPTRHSELTALPLTPSYETGGALPAEVLQREIRTATARVNCPAGAPSAIGENGPDLAGGIGVEAGTCSLGKSGARISNSVCIAAGEALACQHPQKATMGLRMVLLPGWGLWGEVGGTDLTAPVPNAHLELGPMPVGCRVDIFR